MHGTTGGSKCLKVLRTLEDYELVDATIIG